MVIRITPAGKMPAVRECLLCHARWQAFLANRCINTAPPTCPPEIPCAGSVHPVSENGAFCRRGQKSDLPARIRRQEETDRRRHFLGGGNYPVGMGYVPIQSWQQPYALETAFRRGTIFPDLDLPFMMGGAC